MEPTIWYGDSKITIRIVFQVQNNSSTIGRTEAGPLRQHCVWEQARCKCGPPLRSPLSPSSKWSSLGCNPLSLSRGWMMLSCLSNATMKQVLVNVPLILLGVFIWFPLHCWRGLLIIYKEEGCKGGKDGEKIDQAVSSRSPELDVNTTPILLIQWAHANCIMNILQWDSI